MKRYSEKAFQLMDEDSKSKKAAIDNFLGLRSAVPLKVLRDVSNSIDKNITLDLTNFHVRSSGQVTIEGETVDLATAEKIGGLIKNVQSLQGIKMNDPERIPGSDKVKFSISATVKEVN
jgi:hypothetical protein